jgi:uncharacterized protein YjbI with pentapeptide repeats
LRSPQEEAGPQEVYRHAYLPDEKAYIIMIPSRPIMPWRDLAFALLIVASMAYDASASAPSREVPASEILAQIEMGIPVQYDRVSVTGDLNLSAPARTTKTFTITNSVIKGPANLAGAVFQEPVDLMNTTFLDEVDLSRAKFLQDANFNNTRFEENSSFILAQFERHVVFENASFKNVSFLEADFKDDSLFSFAQFEEISHFNYTSFGGYISFYGAAFQNASFSEALFKGSAEFSSSWFRGDADFLKAHFQGYTTFGGSRFDGDAIFAAVRFDEVADYGSARFAKKANFLLSRFDDASYFGGAHFYGDASFGLAQFERLSYFGSIIFDGDLILKSAKIYAIQLDNATFAEGSRIFLKDADFYRFLAHWSMIKDNLVYDGAAYIALVKNYRELEWYDDSDNCYYQYRWESQARKPLGWAKLIDILAWIACGYGVRPSYTVLLSLFTILFFGLLFFFTRALEKTSSKEKKGGEESSSRSPSFAEAFYFSATVFLPNISPEFQPRGRYKYVVVLEALLGWLLQALLLVTLGKVMIR